MSTYDSLRRQARTLESVLDGKMAAYSRLGTRLDTHDISELEAGRQERWSDLEAEIEGLLDKVRGHFISFDRCMHCSPNSSNL
jgi:Golgi SNAP receptor complex protein 1